MVKNLSLSINASSRMNQEYLFIYTIIGKIGYYEELVSFPIGIIGYLISIFIFTRPSLNQKSNTGFLFMILCIINLIKIIDQIRVRIQNCFIRVDSANNSIILIEQSTPIIVSFIFKVIDQSLPWTQALISFDRLIAVFYPVKGIRIMNKKWVLFSIILGLLVFIITTNSVYFLNITATASRNNTNSIKITVSNEKLPNIIHGYIEVLMSVFIPYMVILLLDIVVIVRLRRSKVKIGSRQTVNNRSRSFRFMVNTILIDLIYLIFILPNLILEVLYFIKFDRYSKLFVVFAVLAQLKIYCRLFFVLFFIFNRIFRHEFIAIFKRNSFFRHINVTLSRYYINATISRHL